MARQVAEGAELPETGQLHGPQGVGHHFSLLGVVRGGNALEDLEPSERLGSLGSLMGKHASDGPPEDPGGRAVMYKSPAGVGEQSLPQKLGEPDLVPEEGAGDIDALCAHNRYSLS